MILKVFTVHDIKAESYLSPFFMNARGLAIRAFSSLANDSTHDFSKYPEDYTLFEIGEYDDQTGIISPLTNHVPIGKAIDYITK